MAQGVDSLAAGFIMNETESLAADFHRALAFGHVVAVWFNWRRRNWRWVAFHAVVAGFDLHAAGAHERDSNG